MGKEDTHSSILSTSFSPKMAKQSQIRQNYHEECEALVNKQVNMELYYSYVYLSMSAYFARDDIALPGFAAFFAKTSAKEKNHGAALMKYQTIGGAGWCCRTSPSRPPLSGGPPWRPWSLCWTWRGRWSRASWSCRPRPWPRQTSTWSPSCRRTS